MQAVGQRSCRGSQPFTSTSRPPCTMRPVRQQRLLVASAAAAAEPISSDAVKLRVRMRGYDVLLLREATDSLRSIADATGVDFKGPVMLPTRRKIFCVLRSPHVDKDAREHFEIRTHHRLVDLANLSSQAVEAMMNWVPPAGLEVECSLVAA